MLICFRSAIDIAHFRLPGSTDKRTRGIVLSTILCAVYDDKLRIEDYAHIVDAMLHRMNPKKSFCLRPATLLTFVMIASKANIRSCCESVRRKYLDILIIAAITVYYPFAINNDPNEVTILALQGILKYVEGHYISVSAMLSKVVTSMSLLGTKVRAKLSKVCKVCNAAPNQRKLNLVINIMDAVKVHANRRRPLNHSNLYHGCDVLSPVMLACC